jgi:hypothetical protein
MSNKSEASPVIFALSTQPTVVFDVICNGTVSVNLTVAGGSASPAIVQLNGATQGTVTAGNTQTVNFAAVNGDSVTVLTNSGVYVSPSDIAGTVEFIAAATPTPTAPPNPTSTPAPTGAGGSLFVAGYAGYGQIDLDLDSGYVSLLTQSGIDTTWQKVAGGYTKYMFAQKNDNTWWFTGYNQYGMSGNSDTTDRSSFVQFSTDTDWLEVYPDTYSVFAKKSNGSLWSWGSATTAYNAQISGISYSSPVQVIAGTFNSISLYLGGLAVFSDNNVYAWGTNSAYRFTDIIAPGGFGEYLSSPVQILSGGDWSKVALNNSHSAFLKTNGTLWAMGDNSTGQLGQNNTDDTSSPVQVGSDTTWTQVYAGYFSTYGLKSDNTLWAWGYNYEGQFGNLESGNYYSSPIQVLGNINWQFVNVGHKFVTGIDNAGQLWRWGYNSYYNLADGTFDPMSSPVQVSIPAANWLSVASGYGFVFGVGDTNVPTPTTTTSPIPTDTPTPTPSPSPSESPSPTPSDSPSPTPSPTPSDSPSPTPSDSPSPTPSPSPSESPSPTPSDSPSPTPSPTPSDSPSPTPSPSPSESPVPTGTPIPTNLPTATETPSPTVSPDPTSTPSPTPSDSPSPTPSDSPSPTPSPSPSESPSPTPSDSPSPTPSPSPSESPVPTGTPIPTNLPTATETPSPTVSPDPTSTPSPTPSDSPSPTPSPSPSESPSPTPSDSPSPTPSPSPSESPSPTPSPSPSESPSPTPSDSPSPTPSPSPSESPSPTPSDSPSPTPSPSPSESPSPTPSDSPSPTPSPTPSATPSPIVLSPSVLSLMQVGELFSETISATGGTPPYTYAVTSGVLPSGLSLNSLTGVISGTPTTAGAYGFTITATDSVLDTGSTTYTGIVAGPTIDVVTQTNFITTPVVVPGSGFAFTNIGTGLGNLYLQFAQTNSKPQSVEVTTRNGSSNIIRVNVNSINYQVNPGENLARTFVIPFMGLMTISSLVTATYVAGSVTGEVYVAGSDNCLYTLHLTPADRAVEGDEGSLDTSVINGRSIQRTGYFTITENVTQVKVMEIKDEGCINTQIQQLPEVIPLVCSGYPKG